MLTLKWVTDQKNERLYEAKNIVWKAPTPDTDEKVKVEFSIIEGDGTQTECSINTGTIYVMNDAGATVSTYYLASEEYPNGVMPRRAA